VGLDRVRPGGSELERIRLFGRLVSTPDRRPSLCFDFLDQPCCDELRRNLLGRPALQLRWQEAILTLRRCAQQLTLLITKFEPKNGGWRASY
jgi:hypothetical protein